MRKGMRMKPRSSRGKEAITSILSRPYSRILIPQEGGRFSAEILEFQGCFAEGDSAAIAYGNLEHAAEAWVGACLAAGTPVPEPLTNYDVSGKFALRLPRSLYQRASKVAAREGISLNQLVMNSLAEKLGAHAAEEKFSSAVAELKQLTRTVLGGGFERFADNSPTGEVPGSLRQLSFDQSATTRPKH